MLNGAKIFHFRTSASLIGTFVTNGLIKPSKAVDKSFDVDADEEDIHILSTIVAYDVYMSVSSNFSLSVNNDVIYLDELNNSTNNSTIKVRIIRLWEHRNHKPPHELWSMEMVLVDEKGNKMRSSMIAKFLPKFTKEIQLNSTLLINNSFLADLKLNQRILGKSQKITFNVSTTISFCDDFQGEPFGFSFVSFKEMNANIFPPYHTVDIIGCVTNWFPLEAFGQKGPNDVKMTLKVFDEFKQSINLTLFGDYAKEMDAFIKKYPTSYSVVIILQFGKFSFYNDETWASNNYYVSKLFIDEDIPAINVFKQSWIANGCDLSCSSKKPISSSSICTVKEDFLEHTPFNCIAELETDKIKSIIILGTIVHIPDDQEWYYYGCGRCFRALKAKITSSEDEDPYQCLSDKCQGMELSKVPRFRIHLRVQDTTGTVSLTLWDRDATYLLDVDAKTLVDEVNGGFNMPSVFGKLLDKKFAFKIEVKQYNVLNSSMNFNISKVTDDSFIVESLEKKFPNEVVEISESNQISSAGDNAVTPITIRDDDIGISATSTLKRSLDEVYENDDHPVANSTTKAYPKDMDRDLSEVKKNLLIPKKEK